MAPDTLRMLIEPPAPRRYDFWKSCAEATAADAAHRHNRPAILNSCFLITELPFLKMEVSFTLAGTLHARPSTLCEYTGARKFVAANFRNGEKAKRGSG